MKVSAFLSPSDVMTDVISGQKRALLQELAHKAAIALELPERYVSAELMKREELGSTGTGGGVAIPHARVNGVSKPFGLLVKLRQPIDFEAIDGKPVDIVFLLLLPNTTNGEPLSALACAARMLRSSSVLRGIRSAATAGDVYSAVTQH